jgi:hypothetical protein
MNGSAILASPGGKPKRIGLEGGGMPVEIEGMVSGIYREVGV